MITKMNNCEIKHRPNIETFLNYDNLVKNKTKPVMNLNSQLI